MNKCIYSTYCGGCQLQGIEYSKQLEYKQKSVFDEPSDELLWQMDSSRRLVS